MENKMYFREKNSHYRLDGKPKVGYMLESDAVIRCYQANMSDSQVRKLNPYKCRTCGMWHIGESGKMLSQSDKDKIRTKYKELLIKLS